MLGSLEDPQLAGLARDGVFRSLFPKRGMTYSRHWTTLATGREPRKHCIVGYRRQSRGYTSYDRAVPAIWMAPTELPVSARISDSAKKAPM